METNFQAICVLVEEAKLSPEAREWVSKNLSQLPGLYEELARTAESRFRDKILERVQIILRVLLESPEGMERVDSIYDQLTEMHEQFGIPGLGLKRPQAPKMAKPRSRAK